jgi:DNA repair exonuclease SbcCD ATPase subunit
VTSAGTGAILKTLSDIEKIDAAALKAQIEKLYEILVDVKVALSNVREAIHEKDKKIRELEEKIAGLAALEQFADHYRRFQGRLNALELTVTLGTLNFAKLQADPFEWVQDYVEATRQSSKALFPDVDDSSKSDRLSAETRDGIDELLAQLLQHAAQLRGRS